MKLAETSAPFAVNLAEGRIEFGGLRSLMDEAAQTFGVDLEDQEREDWLTMLRAAYVIDEYLDEEKSDIMPQIAAMLSGNSIAGIPERFQNQCRQFMERQSETRRLDIIKKLGQVTTLVGEHAIAESVHDLIIIRRQEADLFANLLELPSLNRPDEVQRKEFNSWLAIFSRSGYLVDSLMDLKADYLSGASSVRPTLHARSVLAGAAAKDTYIAIRETPKKVLGRCALVGIKNQVFRRKPDFTDPDQLI